MGEHILYLLGAGASCNALPLSSNFANRLNEFSRNLEDALPVNEHGNAKTPPPNDPIWGSARKEFLNSVKWLASETSRHYSVDTFAKKLFFLRDRDNLKKLKATLSAYLVIEQTLRNLDMRYDAFFASVLEFGEQQNVRLPEHIYIMTWNYDAQLEKAFWGFSKKDECVWQEITFNKRILRLNGICGTNPPGQIDDSFRLLCSTEKTFSEISNAWERGISLFKDYMRDLYSPDPDIRFAWEDMTHTLINNNKLNLSDITVIVVIGYSFPYYNKEIDDRIFKQFGRNLHQVYLQCPEKEYKAVESRLEKLLPPLENLIVRVNSTDLFYIPDEL